MESTADQEFTLTRTGNAPLRLAGTQLVDESSRTGDEPRWYEVDVYRTRGGRHVVAITYRTQWDGEHNYYEAEEVADSELIERLRGYDPLEHVLGFPPGMHEKQERLYRTLRTRWESLVSEVAELLGLVEVVD